MPLSAGARVGAQRRVHDGRRRTDDGPGDGAGHLLRAAVESSVAIVEKYWLLFVTVIANLCGLPWLSTPANGYAPEMMRNALGEAQWARDSCRTASGSSALIS